MELLTSSSDSGEARLCSRLRMPTQSRLQKVHNVDLALSVLRSSSSAPPPADITSRAIVDGHREKTLALLWHVILGFQLDRILDEEKLRQELEHLEKSLRYRVQIRDAEAVRGFAFVAECRQRELKGGEEEFLSSLGEKEDEHEWVKGEKIRMLLKWSRLVCAHYGIEVTKRLVLQD